MDRLVDIFMNFSGPAPYLLVFVLLIACGLGLPMPEDITLFAAGIICYYGAADVRWMIVLCYLGVMMGDSVVFFLGHRYGPAIRQRRFFQRILPPRRLEKVQQELRRRGAKLMFAARFMPGLRAPIFFTAGTLHLPFRTFFFYDGLAAVLSVPAIVYVVYYFGEEVDKIIRLIKKVQFGILGLILLSVIVIGLKLYNAHKQSKEEES